MSTGTEVGLTVEGDGPRVTEGGGKGANAPPTTAAADQVLMRTLLEDRRAMQANLDVLTRLVERSHTPAVDRRSSPGELKLTKFSETTDDIEAYLTTFERLMTAHHVDTAQWAYLLASQLTGKVQQAFAAMPSAKSGTYGEVKRAILKSVGASFNFGKTSGLTGT